MPQPSARIFDEMIQRARDKIANAYCPYSKFPVSAVVLSERDQMFAGCNVENASFGLSICAERNAVFQMIAHARRKILAVVIYTPTATPSAPCGACRQVINEFGPDALILCVCDGPRVIKGHLNKLLPNAFGPQNLE